MISSCIAFGMLHGLLINALVYAFVGYQLKLALCVIGASCVLGTFQGFLFRFGGITAPSESSQLNQLPSQIQGFNLASNIAMWNAQQALEDPACLCPEPDVGLKFNNNVGLCSPPVAPPTTVHPVIAAALADPRLAQARCPSSNTLTGKAGLTNVEQRAPSPDPQLSPNSSSLPVHMTGSEIYLLRPSDLPSEYGYTPSEGRSLLSSQKARSDQGLILPGFGSHHHHRSKVEPTNIRIASPLARQDASVLTPPQEVPAATSFSYQRLNEEALLASQPQQTRSAPELYTTTPPPPAPLQSPLSIPTSNSPLVQLQNAVQCSRSPA